MYDVYIGLDEVDKAYKELLVAKTLAEKNDLKKELVEIYSRLSNYAEITNNMKDGFYYNKKHIELMANYFNSQNKALINDKKKNSN